MVFPESQSEKRFHGIGLTEKGIVCFAMLEHRPQLSRDSVQHTEPANCMIELDQKEEVD